MRFSHWYVCRLKLELPFIFSHAVCPMLVIILFPDPGEFDDTPTVNLEFSNSSHITVSLHQWMNNMTGDVPPTR